MIKLGKKTKGILPMSWFRLMILLLAGLSAAAARFPVAATCRCAPARELSVYDYSRAFFSSVLGFFLFGRCRIPSAGWDIWSSSPRRW